MVFTRLVAVPLTLIMAALSACTSFQPSTQSSTTTSKLPSATPTRYCQAQDLKIAFVKTSAATSFVGGRFHVVNTSKQPCLVEGYPSVVAYGPTGSISTLHVVDGGVSPLGAAYDYKPKLLVLQPNRYALILAAWSDVGTYSHSCPKIAKLYFTLPRINADLPVNVTAPNYGSFSPCSGKVNMSPVEFLNGSK